MHLKKEDIKKLYREVEDLTYSFTSINPVIFLENKNWHTLLNEAKLGKTARELQVLFPAYSLGWIRITLNKMEKSGLLSKKRKELANRRKQKCPYLWSITGFGEKILRHSGSKYQASQRLVVFRCLLNLDQSCFAKLLLRKSGVISNWESGCRAIVSVTTAEEYASILEKNISLQGKINLNEVLKLWAGIKTRQKYKQAKRSRELSFEVRSAMGKKGGKAGDRERKRKHLIQQLAKQKLTVYEEKIVSLLHENSLSFETHPVINDECFDFKIGKIILEAENKRGFAQAYAKAHRLILNIISSH